MSQSDITGDTMFQMVCMDISGTLLFPDTTLFVDDTVVVATDPLGGELSQVFCDVFDGTATLRQSIFVEASGSFDLSLKGRFGILANKYTRSTKAAKSVIYLVELLKK